MGPVTENFAASAAEQRMTQAIKIGNMVDLMLK
jgi:hypothetical protein